MLYKSLLGGAWTATTTFIRYRLSALGLRKFAGEVAGVYAIDEMVNLAANHSKWVEENKFSLTAGLSLGLMAKNSFFKLLSNGGLLKGKNILFSNFKLEHAFSSTRAWFKEMTIAASGNGVTVNFRGTPILTLRSDGKTLSYSHTGAGVTAAILAASFGGSIPKTREDWELTGAQLAVQLSDLFATDAEAELRERLSDFSPVTLLSSGTSVIRMFLSEFPQFPEEKAVAILNEVMATESIISGRFALRGFKDYSGDNLIQIGGTFFNIVEEGDAFVLDQVHPEDGPETPLDEKYEEVLYLVEAALRKLQADGSVTMARVGETTRFLSTPFTKGKNSLAFFWSAEDMRLRLTVASSSLLDSSVENLEDEFSEGEWEFIERMLIAIPRYFGLADSKEEADKEKLEEVATAQTFPVLADAYRTGHITLDVDQVESALGKG